MEASNIIRRFEKIMKYYSLSTMEFSLKTGIPKSIVDVMINSDHRMTLITVQKICAAFPQVNARWLLLGKGAFLMETKNDRLLENELKIYVIIEDYKMPLVILRTNEELFLAAGKTLKAKIDAYKREHLEVSIQRVLKLVGYFFAIEFTRNMCKVKPTARGKPTHRSLYRQAAIKYREKLNFNYAKFPNYEYTKLYAITAYQFAVKYQRTIDHS